MVTEGLSGERVLVGVPSGVLPEAETSRARTAIVAAEVYSQKEASDATYQMSKHPSF